ncbi:hypothetical protein LDL59_04470 [Kaistella anthropi]|nr:hypothetical protein [Kaistella anthropi]
MTLPIALELGKTMFGISTNIQLGLMILVFFNFFLNPSKLNKFIICTGVLLALILVLEKFWMLPILDARADVLATGKASHQLRCTIILFTQNALKPFYSFQ